MRSILSVLVENESGVLARISAMFSRRGYNIESLTVGASEKKNLSRIILVTHVDSVEQIKKQLNKLINVIKITDLSEQLFVDRELALIRVNTKNDRSQVIEIADLFKAKITDVAADSLVLEITGDSEKINTLLQLLKPQGIQEIARTGTIALARGMKVN